MNSTDHIPMLRSGPILKGFFSGSLVAGSIGVPYGILIQIALFILAAILFVESNFTFGRSKYILSNVAMGMLGIIVGIAFWVAGQIEIYIAIILLGVAVTYIIEYVKKKAHR